MKSVRNELDASLFQLLWSRPERVIREGKARKGAAGQLGGE
ncbi:MAG: hypothetical protein ACOYM3_11230 [Terrimicrobiaceae bacterium]